MRSDPVVGEPEKVGPRRAMMPSYYSYKEQCRCITLKICATLLTVSCGLRAASDYQHHGASLSSLGLPTARQRRKSAASLEA